MATDRPCRKTSDFRQLYRKDDENKKSVLQSMKNYFTCNKERAIKCVNNFVPSYRIMKHYTWKTDFIQDLICGMTVGIMQLPQGMAYAMLADVPPVVGLYMSCFPVFIYSLLGTSKHISMGMAYAMLADVPPVVGLYMSCFPVFIYSLLGTSKHISMGTVTVVSLLTGSVIARFYGDETGPTTVASTNSSGNVTVYPVYQDDDNDDDDLPTLPDDIKIKIIITLTFLVGIVQILMGSLKLGIITTYMSDPLVSGFTTAAGVYGGSGQIKHIFGIKIPRSYGMFQIIKMYIYIIERLTTTNMATLAMSTVCILTLYLVKAQINQRFKDKLKIPVPIELIVVIIATIASFFGKFHEKYQMAIVGDVPAGLPAPGMPNFNGVGRYVSDIFVIAVISFAQSVSVAALMAQKHGYSIDANQELKATGVANMFGSFFACYPIAASVCRTYVQDSAGGKTQLANIFSATLVLVVIIWIGPLFEPLPKCVLSSIVLVALRCLVLQVLELPRMWRTSKYDFCTWVVTCVGAVILNADYGLFIGLMFSFFTVVVRSQRAKPTKLGKIEDEKVYMNTSAYDKTTELKGITIIGFQAPLYFANSSFFVREVQRLSGANPEQQRKQKPQEQDLTTRTPTMLTCTISTADLIGNSSCHDIPSITRNSISSSSSRDHYSNSLNNSASNKDVSQFKAFCGSIQGSMHDRTINGILYLGDVEPGLVHDPVNYIILDFSGISFMDTVGCKVLKRLIIDYESVDIQVFLANVSDEVWEVFIATEVIPTYQNNIFLTVDDAVVAAKSTFV